MQIDATTATLLASAIGAVSTGAMAIIILLINKRSEERRHVRELAMKAALDNWIHMSKAATEYSRSHDAVIRVYDEGGNVIETHEQAGDFKEA